MALALTHHLRYRDFISYADQIKTYADLLSPHGYLIIEFIPHTDPQIPYLHTTPTLLPDHTEAAFENELSKLFEILEKVLLSPTERKLYLAKKR